MKKFFQLIGIFFTSVFTNAETFAKKHIVPNIQLLDNLKDILQNPVTDLFVALIPGKWDDALKERSLKVITAALNAAYITADIVNEQSTTNKIVKLLEYLRTLSPSMRKALLFKLSVEMAKQSALLDNEKLPPGSTVDLLVQATYTNYKQKPNLTELEKAVN